MAPLQHRDGAYVLQKKHLDTSGLGFNCPEVGMSWWLAAPPGPVEQDAETEQGQHHRGGDNGLSLERAETIFSAGVVEEYWVACSLCLRCPSL